MKKETMFKVAAGIAVAWIVVPWVMAAVFIAANPGIRQRLNEQPPV